VIRFTQPAFDCTPVARFGEKRRRMRCGGGDEFLALLAHLFTRCRLFGEMAGGRRVRLFARTVEALP